MAVSSRLDWVCRAVSWAPARAAPSLSDTVPEMLAACAPAAAKHTAPSHSASLSRRVLFIRPPNRPSSRSQHVIRCPLEGYSNSIVRAAEICGWCGTDLRRGYSRMVLTTATLSNILVRPRHRWRQEALG